MYVSLVRVRVGNLVWSDGCETSCVFVCGCVCLFMSVAITLLPFIIVDATP